MGADEFGKLTLREFYYLWNRWVEDVDLKDSQFALTRAMMVNMQIDRTKNDPVPVESLKLVKIRRVGKGGDLKQLPDPNRPQDWEILKAQMQSFTDALNKRRSIVQKKV